MSILVDNQMNGALPNGLQTVTELSPSNDFHAASQE